jgi:hypothetical protein
MTPGSSTFATAMPAPITTVPPSRPIVEGTRRTAVPTQIAAMEASRVDSVPNRRPRRGARGASRPKHSSGSVVSRLPAAADIPVSCLMVSSSGDTATIDGRRLSASTTKPIARNSPALAAGGRT